MKPVTSTLPLRLVALAPASYSSALVAAPRLLARPAGLTAPDGSVPPDVAALTRSVGTRDAALALALAFSRSDPRVLGMLTAARVASDTADAAWFAGIVSDPKQRAKVCGAALGWAALETAALLWSRNR
jgi:hypothetical protein